MSRTSRRLPLAPLLVALLLGGGCSATVAGAPAPDPAPAPTAGPGSDPVAWTDRLCGAVLTFAVPATAPPDYAAAPDLPAVHRTLSAHLAALVSGAQQGRALLDALGAAPVAGGNAAVGRVWAAMTQLEQDLAATRAALDATDPNDAAGLAAALDRAEAELAALSTPDPLGEIAGERRLQKAAGRAEQCRQVAALAAAAPR